MNNIVEVTWDDAWIDTDDFKLENAMEAKPVRRHTVGYLICRNETGVVLCTDMYEEPEDDYAGAALMVIPEGMIAKLTYLQKQQSPNEGARTLGMLTNEY